MKFNYFQLLQKRNLSKELYKTLKKYRNKKKYWENLFVDFKQDVNLINKSEGKKTSGKALAD